MGFKCGIVGLPNVGKSTLFNALTATMAAEAANFPFCTIEPNVGRVAVSDTRLYKLAAISGSQKIIPAQIEFVDIAGLVKGASKGEGLGNQFLGHIREVDAIVYVLRCFHDENIVHVEGEIDPIRDVEIIEMELILSDLESLQKRFIMLEKKAKSDKTLVSDVALMRELLNHLSEGKPARSANLVCNKSWIDRWQLLTSKPIMYVCNVDEASVTTGNKYSDLVKKRAESQKVPMTIISAQIEQEISVLPNEEDKKEFLLSMGLEEAGLDKIIRAGYKLLNLITYFTVGPKEARAWTIINGTLAPQAAGVIHTDFENGFIRAETISYDDYIKFSGEVGAKDNGKMRLEGKEYVVHDGDVMHFRFNV